MTGQRCKVAVLASGRGSNFRAIAEACRNDDFPADVVCFITDNPDAPALEIAQEFAIPSHIVAVTEKKARLPAEDEARIADLCKNSGVQLIALAGFMRILKGALLDRFDGRIMNVHPALLPSFKGLHGARQTLEYGAKIAGCTVHFVDRTVDGGAIIVQAAVPVKDEDTEEMLVKRINKEEHRIYVEAIDLFARGKLQTDGRRVKILDPAYQSKL